MVTLFPPNIKCEEQFDNFDMIGLLEDDKENVEGLACRVTALPTASTNRSRMALVTPLLLAARLDSINLNRTHGFSNLTDEILEYGGS